jgi:hypothetical protein
MPPCGFNSSAVKGALQFIRGCYEDLLEDVKSGKYTSYEEAIEHELSQIEKALTDLHIDEQGHVVAKGGN